MLRATVTLQAGAHSCLYDIGLPLHRNLRRQLLHVCVSSLTHVKLHVGPCCMFISCCQPKMVVQLSGRDTRDQDAALTMACSSVQPLTGRSRAPSRRAARHWSATSRSTGSASRCATYAWPIPLPNLVCHT